MSVKTVSKGERDGGRLHFGLPSPPGPPLLQGQHTSARTGLGLVMCTMPATSIWAPLVTQQRIVIAPNSLQFLRKKYCN